MYPKHATATEKSISDGRTSSTSDLMSRGIVKRAVSAPGDIVDHPSQYL